MNPTASCHDAPFDELHEWLRTEGAAYAQDVSGWIERGRACSHRYHDPAVGLAFAVESAGLQAMRAFQRSRHPGSGTAEVGELACQTLAAVESLVSTRQRFRRASQLLAYDPRALAVAVELCCANADPRQLLRTVTLSLQHSDGLDIDRFGELHDYCNRLSAPWCDHAVNIGIAAAAYLGVRPEYRILRNFECLRDHMPWANKAWECVHRHEVLARCESFVKLIAAALDHGGVVEPPRWEWRHLASIADALRADPSALVPADAGFVTLVFSNRDACYLALGMLHQAFEHRRVRLRDYADRLHGAQYRALHTTLVVESGNNPSLISVRLIASNDSWQRGGCPPDDALQRSLARDWRGTRVRVFTPAGEVRDLEPPATVLDFAVSIHSDFALRVREAFVGPRAVDLRHRLSPWDVVQLVLDPEPRPLPEGWESAVAPHSAQAIREALRRRHLAHDVAGGHRRLRAELTQRGFDAEPDDALLDALLEDALGALEKERAAADAGAAPPARRTEGQALSRTARPHVIARTHLAQPLTWWLEQMACAKPEMHEALALLYGAIIKLKKELRRTHELRDDAGTLLDAVSWCTTCNPTSNSPLVVRSEGGMQVLHAQDSPCAVGGRSVHRRPRWLRSSVFVVGTRDRVGVAEEILEVFRKESVDIEEIAARKIGSNGGVVRVEAGALTANRAARITARLHALVGSGGSVAGPRDPRSHLESYLPSRGGLVDPSAPPQAPYSDGPAIRDDRFFYGRGTELQALTEQIARTDGDLGVSIKLLAPLRWGKTSLALKLKRALTNDRDRPYVVVYVECPEGASAKALTQRVAQDLRRELSTTAAAWNGRVDGMEKSLCPLLEWSATLPWKPIVVLLIDEFPRAFARPAASSTERASRASLLRIGSIPGAATVWIGPKAGVNRLTDVDVQNMLSKAYPVELGPLSTGEIRDLLEAKRYGMPYQISTEDGVPEKLRQLSAGHPWLVGLLARRLWDLASTEQAGLLRYRRTHVDEAASGVVADDFAFKVVLGEEAEDPSSRTYWCVLRELALARETGASRLTLAQGLLDKGLVVPPEDGVGEAAEAILLAADRGILHEQRRTFSSQERLVSELLWRHINERRSVTTRNSSFSPKMAR